MRYVALAIAVAALAAGAAGVDAIFGSQPCDKSEQAILDEIRHFADAEVEFREAGGLNLYGSTCAAHPEFDAPAEQVMRHYLREFRRLGWRASLGRNGGTRIFAPALLLYAERAPAGSARYASFSASYIPDDYPREEEPGFTMFIVGS